MDVRNNILVVVIYAVLSVTVAVVFALGYRLYFRPAVDSQLALITADAASQSARSAPLTEDGTHPRTHRRQSFEEALRRIDQLKRLLDEKTALLNEKSRRLDKKTVECEKLSEEASKYFAMVTGMTMSDSPGDGGLGETVQVDESMASRAEMERLEDELGQTDVADETLEVALSAAEWELEQAYAELAEAQQFATDTGTQSPVESVASDLLVEVGASAVPTLAAALADDRAEVRKWAANVLGRIGGASIAAADALTIALRDSDPAVREAAGDALVRIEADF